MNNIIKNDIISMEELKALQTSNQVSSVNQVGVTGFYDGYDIYKIKLIDGNECEVYV